MNKNMAHHPIPLWLKIAYTAMVFVIVPVYWVQHGPSNFLWFSDIALFAVLITLWHENRLLPSMMAIGVLPLEIIWMIDFVLGGPFQIAAYMFDDTMPLYLRGLSLFHLVMPPVLIYLLRRSGYDQRALLYQSALIWLVLPVTYMVNPEGKNINWVLGFGTEPQEMMDPRAYLVLLMVLVVLIMHIPMHFLLKTICRTPKKSRS